MRVLLVIVALVLVMLVIGWLRFSSPEGNPTIQIDGDKVKQDTSSLVDSTKSAVNQAADSIDNSIDDSDIDDPVTDETVITP